VTGAKTHGGRRERETEAQIKEKWVLPKTVKKSPGRTGRKNSQIKNSLEENGEEAKKVHRLPDRKTQKTKAEGRKVPSWNGGRVA